MFAGGWEGLINGYGILTTTFKLFGDQAVWEIDGRATIMASLDGSGTGISSFYDYSLMT